MLLLAIESSGLVASIAIMSDDKVIGEYTTNFKKTHSQTLLPMMNEVTQMTGIALEDLDAIVISGGPGSFTGVRIGAATLKGLAFASDKPCVGVSTLHAIAKNLSLCKGLICPVMNARRAQVYTALFRSNGQTLERLIPDSAMSIAELDEKLAEFGEPVYFSGDGYGVTVPALSLTEALPVPDRLRHQSAYSVACVAYAQYLRGEYTDDLSLKVNYLRPSQAERELMNKNKEEN